MIVVISQWTCNSSWNHSLICYLELYLASVLYSHSIAIHNLHFWFLFNSVRLYFAQFFLFTLSHHTWNIIAANDNNDRFHHVASVFSPVFCFAMQWQGSNKKYFVALISKFILFCIWAIPNRIKCDNLLYFKKEQWLYQFHFVFRSWNFIESQIFKSKQSPIELSNPNVSTQISLLSQRILQLVCVHLAKCFYDNKCIIVWVWYLNVCSWTIV